MAEYDERSSDDLTEEPSAYRLEEMRSKGQVAQSKELTAAAVFFAAVTSLNFLGKEFTANFMEFMKSTFQQGVSYRVDWADWIHASDFFRQTMVVIGKGMIPFFVLLVMIAIGASVAQTRGFILNTEITNIDFSRLNPLSGLGKIFSFLNFLEGIKAIAKFAVVVGVVYKVLNDKLIVFPNLTALSFSQISETMADLVIRLAGSLAFIMVLFGGIDFFIQWMSFRKKAMMTKAEAKQELKEREGDPQIKARVRSVQREMARKRMMKAVPKADVIITNPTHFAIAIVYEKDLLAPKVVAKGADFLAEKIKALAKEHSVPVVENRILARTLYKTVKVGQLIPRSLYQAVAEVLAYVYKLRPKKVLDEKLES